MPVPRPIPGQRLSQAYLTGAEGGDNILGQTGGTLTGVTLASPAVSGTMSGTFGTTQTGDLTLTGDLTVTGAIDHQTGNVGFFAATPVAQQSALTTQHAALTQAGTDNADVTIQAATNTGPYGFVNADEFEAVIASLINLMTRVQEIEDALQAYGLLA